jgi:hypothetical protein
MKQELLQAYQITFKYLSSCRFKPCLHKMDNKTSKDAEDFIQSQQTSLQYTPSDIHCTNSAKRAIYTWKNHFIAGIASLPKIFTHRQLVLPHQPMQVHNQHDLSLLPESPPLRF